MTDQPARRDPARSPDWAYRPALVSRRARLDQAEAEGRDRRRRLARRKARNRLRT